MQIGKALSSVKLWQLLRAGSIQALGSGNPVLAQPAFARNGKEML